MTVSDSQCGGALSNSDYYGSSPYRVQRHAANIRERKRMLRSAIGPTGYTCLDLCLFLLFLLELGNLCFIEHGYRSTLYRGTKNCWFNFKGRALVSI